MILVVTLDAAILGFDYGVGGVFAWGLLRECSWLYDFGWMFVLGCFGLVCWGLRISVVFCVMCCYLGW